MPAIETLRCRSAFNAQAAWGEFGAALYKDEAGKKATAKLARHAVLLVFPGLHLEVYISDTSPESLLHTISAFNISRIEKNAVIL